MSESRVYHAAADGWEGVEPASYAEGEGPFRGVVRHTLLGGRDMGDALTFEVRYFEVAPGSHTSLEHHAHPHAVLVVRGHGTVRLGDRSTEIGPHDVVYVAPHEIHRFDAPANEPLGFVCIVDRNRDRPVRVQE